MDTCCLLEALLPTNRHNTTCYSGLMLFNHAGDSHPRPYSAGGLEPISQIAQTRARADKAR